MFFHGHPVIFNGEKRLFILNFIFVYVNIGLISWSLRNDFFGHFYGPLPINNLENLWEVGDHLVIDVTLALLDEIFTSFELLLSIEFSLKLLTR